MRMTLHEYIKNPMGQGNAVMTQKDMYRKLYTEKLDKIIVRENGKINYTLYYTKDDVYYIHIKIPSEVIEKFYYDTIIEFSTTNNALRTLGSLDAYNVRFYSNDPSFVYTYAHAFIKNDLFVADLLPKMSKLAIKNPAKELNPKNVINYVKSLYFAYLIIMNYGLLKKDKFKVAGIKYSKKELLSNVEHADKKVADRQDAQKLLDAKKRRERDEANKDTRNVSNASRTTKAISKTPTVSTVKKVGTVRKTKVVKTK